MGIPTTVLIGMAERLVDRLWDNERAKKAVALLEELAVLAGDLRSALDRADAASAESAGAVAAAVGLEDDDDGLLRERALLGRSPLIAGLMGDGALEPCVEVRKWSRWGRLEYALAGGTGAAFPEGCAFVVVTTDGTRVSEHVSSDPGGMDGNWNKTFRNALTAFMVAVTHAEKGLVGCSRLVDVAAEGQGQ